VYSTQRYGTELQEQWDIFVRASRNGTFLFERGYIEYHADRFVDDSLVFRDRASRIVAVLPASREGDGVISHGGLTYGGLVVGPEAGTCAALALLETALTHYRTTGARTLTYKCVPHIYHKLPAEEDLYALFRSGASLLRRDVSSSVVPGARPALQERRRRGVRKACNAGVVVERSSDFASFWKVLEGNLEERHGLRPVHDLTEIEMLAGRFPGAIKLFVARQEAEVVAGTVIYETQMVAHAQYIGSSPRGKEAGALDLLFDQLIGVVYRDKPYFDFGISTEAGGQVLNEGLVNYKEGHGATATVCDFYRIDL
jgi:hypothetical protein